MVEYDVPAVWIWLFACLLGLHGVIHLIGVAKGFGWAEVEQLSTPVSSLSAWLWLVATVSFVIASVSYVVESPAWWVAGALGVIVSQVLVVYHWQDAWAGSLPNVIILVACVVGFGGWQFNRMVERELVEFRAPQTAATSAIQRDDIDELPVPVRRWLEYSKMVGQRRAMEVTFHQSGRLRTEPGGDWMPVEADQWVRLNEPGFLWIASVKMAPMVFLSGRDKYIDGRGEMLIKLMSLFPVVNASGPKIDQGALVRYLAEMVWYPGAALQEYVSWTPVDGHSARATMSFGDVDADGLFEFDDQGRVIRFSADRYYERPEGATKEKWVVDVEAESYRPMGDIRIPTEASVTWKLDEEFTWYELQVTNFSRLEEEPFQ